jgi:hypothetical protein
MVGVFGMGSSPFTKPHDSSPLKRKYYHEFPSMETLITKFVHETSGTTT